MFKAPEGTKRPVIECNDGRTKTSMQEETDINLIMAKYQKTGLVSFVNRNQGEYLDIPNIDFHQAMNTIKEAEKMFGEMPSSMRKKFRNDPGEFLEYMHDPDNVDEIYELGLAERPQGWSPPVASPSPAKAPAAPETPPEAE